MFLELGLLSGIAAILRFPVPDDEDEDSDDDWWWLYDLGYYFCTPRNLGEELPNKEVRRR